MGEKPEVLAIIPARGGSKSVPRKNIALLCGKPLLAYTIEHALQTPEITRTIVSTDDPEIATVSEEYGAEVIWRPAEISGDKSSSESALLHVLDHLRHIEGYEPEAVVFLQATSPIRHRDDLHKAIQQFWLEDADSMLSVNPFHVFLWRQEVTGVRSLNYDYRQRPMRQDAPNDFIENGSFYIFKPWVLRRNNNRLAGKISLYQMTDMLTFFAVDEPGDLELIEQLLIARKNLANDSR